MKAASRYAASLLQLAVERGELDTIVKDMADIGATLQGSRELVVFLRSPVVNAQQKRAVLKELFDGKVSHTTGMFLDILVKKGREDQIQDVVAAFKKLYNEHVGIVEVEVTTASEISSGQENSLKTALEQHTGKKVVINRVVDPSVRGGIKARIGDTVIDGTVQHKLEQLRKSLQVKG